MLILANRMGNAFFKPTVWQQMVAMEEEEPGDGLSALTWFSSIDLEKFFGKVNDNRRINKSMTVDAARAMAEEDPCLVYIGGFTNAQGQSIRGLLSKITEYPEDQRPP